MILSRAIEDLKGPITRSIEHEGSSNASRILSSDLRETRAPKRSGISRRLTRRAPHIRTRYEALPDLAEGDVRLWRGEKLEQGSYIPTNQYLKGRDFNEERAKTAGRWYHGPTDVSDYSMESPFNRAVHYARLENFGREEQGMLRYVDIPAEQASSMYTPNMSKDYIKSIRGGGEAVRGEYIIDPEFVKQSRPVKAVPHYRFNANEQSLYMVGKLSKIPGYESIAGIEHLNPSDSQAKLEELHRKSKQEFHSAQERLWEVNRIKGEVFHGQEDMGLFGAKVTQAEEEYKTAYRPLNLLLQILPERPEIEPKVAVKSRRRISKHVAGKAPKLNGIVEGRDIPRRNISSASSSANITRSQPPQLIKVPTRRRARANQNVLSRLVFRRR